MKPGEILDRMDPDAGWVEFQRKEAGLGVWLIVIRVQYGDDSVFPEPYTDLKVVNQVIKDLNLAYRIGKKMAARKAIKSLEKIA